MADVKYLDTTGLTYFWNKIKEQLNQKQNTLTAGNNITITGNTISATDTTYDAATTTAAGLMSAADKVKLNGIAAGAEVNVQSDWNATSGDAFIKNKPTLLTLDDIGANNIYMTAGDHEGYLISERIGLMNTTINNKQDKLTFDTTPTVHSANPVTSAGIHSALLGKQNLLSFDTAPTALSLNPVTSNGVFVALSGKQNQITTSTNLTLNSLTASSFTLGTGTVTGITSGFTDSVAATALPTAAGVVSYVTGKNYATQTYVDNSMTNKLYSSSPIREGEIVVGDTDEGREVSGSGVLIGEVIKGLSVDGQIITYTKGDGTTGTITTQDTDTTYSAATSNSLGLVKIGSNISVSSGTISLTKTNVTNALGYTPPTQAYVDEAIADLGDVLEYKGTVTNYSNLPTSPSKGDVYNVTNAYGDYPAGTNFAWNGTAWDALGGAIDLSGYQLAEDLIAITTGEIDTILAS